MNSTERPGSAIPSSSVRHVSPALIDNAVVMAPVVTISFACNGICIGYFPSTAIRCAMAANGLPSTLDPLPTSRTVPSHDKAIVKRSSAAIGSVPNKIDCLGVAYQKRSVQRPVCNGICGLKLPSGKVRLHDSECVCDPVNGSICRPSSCAAFI
jgi:hypothetical protein